jgi:hypothetical protein
MLALGIATHKNRECVRACDKTRSAEPAHSACSAESGRVNASRRWLRGDALLRSKGTRWPATPAPAPHRLS